MAFDRTAADKVLKDLYLHPLRKQINMATPLLAELGRNEENVEGRRSIFPIHSSRSGAVGARADGGTLPTANKQGYTEARVEHTYQYGVIKVTGPTIRSTKSDKGSFVRAVDSEIKGMESELKEDFDRQIAGNDASGNGYLAQLTAVSSTATHSVAAGGAGAVRRVRPGLTVDIVDDNDNSVVENAVTVSSVDPAAGTITFGSAFATDSGYTGNPQVVVNDSVGNEMTGLPGIINESDTLHNIDGSSVAVWNASVFDNSGNSRALSEDLMQQVLDDVANESGEEPDAIVCERTQRRKFFALLSSQKRAVNTLELKGGFKTLTFDDNIPLIVDRFIDDDKMFFISRKHLSLYQLADWDWADDDGSILKWTSGEDAYEAYLYKFCNFGTDRRNAHGRLVDLAT